MSTTYAQKSSTVQKAADTKAASVLDSSAQGESLQRKADMVNNAVKFDSAQNCVVQCGGHSTLVLAQMRDPSTGVFFSVNCKKVPDQLLESYTTAFAKGVVSPTNKSGIKRIGGGYEIKIMGFGGNSRIVGKWLSRTEFLFDTYESQSTGHRGH